MLHALLPIGAIALAVTLAAFALIEERPSFVRKTFALGMMALAIEETFRALSANAAINADTIYWQQLRPLAAAFVPGSWLLFSLTFSRANYQEFLQRWKWVIAVAFIAPLGLTIIFSDAFFIVGRSLEDELPIRHLRLGWSGYAYSVVNLLASVIILMNLERTLRASTGSVRWRIKFVILGIGTLFAIRIYISSQTLLFSLMDLQLQTLNSAALVAASLFLIVSFGRARLTTFDFYISPSFLYNSVTILVAGIYLILVGIMTRAAAYFGGGEGLMVTAFLAFVALVGLTVFLLSDQLRQELRRFVYRNFQRPRYDYRKQWMTFAERTSAVRDTRHLCAVITNMVSGMFSVPSVTLWLLDESKEGLRIGGSTALGSSDESRFQAFNRGAKELLSAMRGQRMPIDFERAELDWARTLKSANNDYFREARIRYCVPLTAGAEMIGLVTLGERLRDDPFSIEDLDLLKTIADQTAAILHNFKLSDDLLQAKEMELFQTLSAFFVHDLKNLASTLSLTLQNFKAHFDKPSFRADAAQTIAQSVGQINDLCTRLSSTTKNGIPQPHQVDLNQLVRTAIASLNGSLEASLATTLRPTPKVLVDPEQMQKVIVNLIKNAYEALNENGRIEVSTYQDNGWVLLSVKDNGSGMSQDFIARSLFRAFQTTKKQGLGIGLFQSKKIVEALGGRIEIDSEPNKGSTFRVFLPASQ